MDIRYRSNKNVITTLPFVTKNKILRKSIIVRTWKTIRYYKYTIVHR